MTSRYTRRKWEAVSRRARDFDDSYAKSACCGLKMLRGQKLNNAPSDSSILQNEDKTQYFTMFCEGAVCMMRGGRIRPGQNRMSREIPQKTARRQREYKIVDVLSFSCIFPHEIAALAPKRQEDRIWGVEVPPPECRRWRVRGLREKVLKHILSSCLLRPKSATL